MKHTLLAATVGLIVCVAVPRFAGSAVQASNATAASASAPEPAQARELLDRSLRDLSQRASQCGVARSNDSGMSRAWASKRSCGSRSCVSSAGA